MGTTPSNTMEFDEDGKVATGPVVKLDTSAGLPSELCWLSISPDDHWVSTARRAWPDSVPGPLPTTACRCTPSVGTGMPSANLTWRRR